VPTTSIAIVEDDAEIAEHLEQVVAADRSFSHVCTCRNAKTALLKIPPLAPEIVVMDINLPDTSGIECTRQLKALLPGTHIVIFTVHDDSEQIFKALEAGASGYLLKRTKAAALLQALDQVRHGGGPMSAEVALKVIQSFHKPDPSAGADRLTQREEEIVHLLAEGCLSKEIAARLFISISTVNTHLRKIYEKLHVRTRTEAVIRYLK
jgi:DNA-binding NarL/FixJ family response regulator